MDSNTPLAPITSYSSTRLYGSHLVAPFSDACQKLRAVSNPIHRSSIWIVEFSIRVFCFLGALTTALITAAPALVGKVCQIIHYHRLSTEDKKGRSNLPHVCPGEVYVRLTNAEAITYLRTGNFKPLRLKSEMSYDAGSCDLPNYTTLTFRVNQPTSLSCDYTYPAYPKTPGFDAYWNPTAQSLLFEKDCLALTNIDYSPTFAEIARSARDD